jgi:uncharacterized protein YdhG (YjbR/CyaY superfamily)
MSDPTTPSKPTGSNVWTDAERAAMKAGAREHKRQARVAPGQERAAGEAAINEAIAELAEDDRAMATRIHQIIVTAAPALMPRTFYGSPAYAREGKVICFFQAKSKYKTRYSTLGFQPDAALDDQTMWPVAFAITDLSAADEKRIADLVKKAAG